MRVEIVNQSSLRVPRGFLDWWVANCVKKLPKSDQKNCQKRPELYLIFLEKKEAKKLNKRFREKNYATDVLSFDSFDEESLGELVFCPEVLKSQAIEHNLSYRFELGYMVLHGILHLLGYEHEKGEKEAKKMFALQDLLFEELCHNWRRREKKRRNV